MSLVPGAKLGNYEVIGPLGAGGMGEVYRARDTRLGREVAVKVLPDTFAQDPDRLARFEREAQVLASLNHPNIATLHGFEHAPVGHALVMELVEGPTLADRIAEGPMPIDEALQVARQIVDALDAAHGQGIVHRDLKPANIKIRPDGTVKILDFGLAKAMAPEGASGTTEAMNSPTLTARATQMGVIIGTAAYMSPEQARGKLVDRRADIWAFGCVLYEMVSGKRLFVGEDLTETLASVVKENPSLEHAPPGLQRLLRKCLEKDPKRRLRDIGDAWDLLEETTPRAAGATTPVAAPSRTLWLAGATAALATVAAVTLAVMYFRQPAPTVARAEFHLAWPADAGGALIGGSHFFEISPNGRYFALVSQDVLWVRAIDAIEPVRLDRTQGATYPFWSPDSEQIGFFQGGQLKAIRRTGGSPRVICDVVNSRGGAWSPRGTIIFSNAFGTAGIQQVPAEGGTPQQATTLAAAVASDDAHRYPQFLPDGTRFLYLHLTAKKEVAGVYVSSLDGMKPVRVLDGVDSARFATSGVADGGGFLIFRRRTALMAQPFDAGRLAASSTPFVVATDVGGGENTGLGAFSVDDRGTLAHGRNVEIAYDLVWLDRSGKRLATVAPGVMLDSFAIAHDQQRLAMGLQAVERGEEWDVWVQPSAGAASKFTFGPAPGWVFPQWSPSDDQIAYATVDLAGLGGYEIRHKAANMAGIEETIVRSTENIYLWDWSKDGKSLVYSTGGDLYLISPDRGSKPAPFLKTPADEQYGQISPNGHWMAYTSGPRGGTDVYVQPIPATGAMWQISKGGGSMPRWRDDGKEFFYRGADGRLIAVPVIETGAGVFAVGATSQALFQVPSLGNFERFAYKPSRDGSRFLVSLPEAGVERPITVVMNWRAK